MASPEFDALAVGTVGTVTNSETGNVWDGEFIVAGKRVLPTTPPKETLTVESVKRLRRFVRGDDEKGIPSEWVETDQPNERCTELPIAWFTPTPAAPAPEATPATPEAPAKPKAK